MNYNLYLDRQKERYCHKCHKIKLLEAFKKSLFKFSNAGICTHCLVRNK